MSLENVRNYLKQFDLDKNINEFDTSSATVSLAAKALNTNENRIAKTLAFKTPDNGCVLICTAGDAKVDNKKFKDFFSFKSKMLSPDEVINFTGHAVGGVCPFAIENKNVKIYLDESLKRFETVFPACGSSNSAIELDLNTLFKISNAASYIDVCKICEQV